MAYVTGLLQALYVVCIALVAAYACGTLYVLLVYVRYARQQPAIPAPPERDSDWPRVTVQLPLYNERYVARRAIDAMAALDYPHDRLHIQILDDSTDDTTDLIHGRIEQLKAAGLRIDLIHRINRQGYKAGALANAFDQTDGDFMAIFDADFIPAPDFLRRVIPHFLENDRIGLVQTRWGHLNAADNALTHSQALAFDGHFGVEQFARSADGIVLSFNGTGGVWRRKCVAEAGGWQSDTLTEDFDLSYRAQIAGWRFKYVRDVVVPGEIPGQIAVYKQQQARWAKGSIQVMLKLIWPLIRSDLSIRNRIMGVMQMMQYAVQMVVLLLLLLTPPMIVLHGFDNLPLGLLSVLTLSAPLTYALGQQALYRQDWPRRMAYLPVLLLLGMGMACNNGRAVISGLLGQPGEFKRTPKFHMNSANLSKNDWWVRSQYASLLATPNIVGEMLLGLYSLLGFIAAVLIMPSMIPSMLIYVSACFLIVGWGLYDRWLLTRPLPGVESEAMQQPGR